MWPWKRSTKAEFTHRPWLDGEGAHRPTRRGIFVGAMAMLVAASTVAPSPVLASPTAVRSVLLGSQARRLGLVANNNRFHTFTSGNAQTMAASACVATEDIKYISVAFSNFFMVNNQPDERGSTGAVNITKASVEYPLGGPRYPIYFGGQRAGSMAATSATTNSTTKTITISDLRCLPIVIPKGAKFRVRWHQTGGAFCMRSGSSDSVLGSGATDNILHISNSGSSNLSPIAVDDGEGTFVSYNMVASWYIPVAAVIGYSTRKSVGIIGDSICHDVTGITSTSADPVDGRVGLIATSLDPGVAFFNGGGSSMTAQSCLGQSASRMQLWPYVSDMFVAVGTNDLAGRTDTNVRDDLRLISNAIPSTVLRKYLCTIMPRPQGGSTDFWTTLTNQTVTAGVYKTNRDALNLRMRTTFAADFGGYYTALCDTAAVFEDGGAGAPTGKWIVNPSSRIIHDAAMTNGSNQLDSASGLFVSTDAGGPPANDNVHIQVNGAGVSGVDLVARIGAFTNTTRVLLITSSANANGQNASTTVSGATAYMDPYTFDGTHPTTRGNKLLAANGLIMNTLNLAA